MGAVHWFIHTLKHRCRSPLARWCRCPCSRASGRARRRSSSARTWSVARGSARGRWSSSGRRSAGVTRCGSLPCNIAGIAPTGRCSTAWWASSAPGAHDPLRCHLPFPVVEWDSASSRSVTDTKQTSLNNLSPAVQTLPLVLTGCLWKFVTVIIQWTSHGSASGAAARTPVTCYFPQRWRKWTNHSRPGEFVRRKRTWRKTCVGHLTLKYAATFLDNRKCVLYWILVIN